MRICTACLRSITPYSQSRQHDEPRKDKETWEDWEDRTWRLKAHVNGTGFIFIPPMSFKQMLDTTIQRLGLQIPGRGKATYTKHFLSGVLVMNALETQTTLKEVHGEWINANADGVRGSGRRVKRCFPVIPKWEGEQIFHILDETITEPIFERVLREGGQFVGIGRFRPQNGGFYGRFNIERISWQK